MLLIGSPERRRYSTWQAYNDVRRDPQQIRREKVRALVHMQFVCELYDMQHAAGRYFLHEHPSTASSWNLRCIRRIMKLEGVNRIRSDQCQFGQTSREARPVKKPTGFMSNSEMLLKELQGTCTGKQGYCQGYGPSSGLKHQICEGGTARRAAKYSDGLCRSILRGIAKQLKTDGFFAEEVGLLAPSVREIVHDLQRNDAYVLVTDDGQPPSGKFRDDVSGQILHDGLVAEA